MRTGRPYMSIGEVLAALKGEFADVSVSKIRFLESEGLLSPERTASGYRMYYQRDVDRLRTILALQRDSFLPLKVIRERLDAGESIPAAAAPAAPPALSEGAASGPPEPPVTVTIEREPEETLLERDGELHLTESDLADAIGLDVTQVRALKEYGVICEHSDNGHAYFDAGDLAVGEIAREFLKLGIEARHLKALRRAAEQEAGMYEALVSPALHNRRPEARRQAVETLMELAKLSRKLRQAYLKQTLRGTLAGDG